MSDSGSRSMERSPLEGMSVLLVDDEPLVRRAIGRVLVLDGALVVEAGDGEQAICILEREEAELLDAVVTDLEMPIVTGHELIAVLHECLPDLPIVAITGYSRPVAFGATVPIFLKPLDPDKLVLTLGRLVHQSRETRRRSRQMRADAAESRSLASRQLGIARQQHAKAVDFRGTLERQRAMGSNTDS
jgi:two-component system, NtrC family, C4-dicarboxylate transport response regulator DctD